MEVFVKLEERIEALIAGYKGLQDRVAELEEENRVLRHEKESDASLASRVAELEKERGEIRARLEKVLATLAAVEL
jgi:FtsZ-binding cell division protein ZapB